MCYAMYLCLKVINIKHSTLDFNLLKCLSSDAYLSVYFAR